MTIDIEKVLAMSELEKVYWLDGQGYIPADLKKLWYEEGLKSETILTTLAFRLRDEAVKENKERWLRACYEVDNMAGDYKDGRIYNCNNGYSAEYNTLMRGPIHWILAAMKAKENE